MTEHITDIESELKAKEVEIYETSVAYREESRDAAEKRAVYDIEYAKAMLNITHTADQNNVKMTVAERESLAVKAVSDELKACRIAEALADATKRHLEALQAILSSIQTRSRMIQTERSLTGRQV